MNFIQYNPNPRGNRVGDCVIRAISKATGRDWETTYAGVCLSRRSGFAILFHSTGPYPGL